MADPGMLLAEKWEQKRNRPYLDAHTPPIPTQGFGATRGLDGRPIKLTDAPWTDEQCEFVFRRDWITATKGNSAVLKVPLNTNEAGAFGSLTFNVGIGNIRNSTLLRKINQDDQPAVAEQWVRWDRAGGRELKGLLARRREELELWQR